MDYWPYMEQVIIGGLFLWACWQLINRFRPSKSSGCSKGCGDACPASRISERLDQIDWDNLPSP